MKNLIAISALTVLALSSHAQTADPYQSKAAPYSLPTAGTVMQAGSDAASKNFDANVLPQALEFIKSAFPESHNNTKSSGFEIDPSKIVLATAQDVTATFIYEGAAYHNSIGFDALAPGKSDPSSSWDLVKDPNSKLIFPDASSSASGYNDWGSVAGVRSPAEPLLPGDFTDIGKFIKGTKLDFFLLANGAQNYWASTFSTQESLNSDGFTQHVAGFTTHLFAVPQLNSPYLFLSFEDLWGGGDHDINDTIIAINVGTATVNSLLATPEPTMAASLAGFLALAFVAGRKKLMA